MPYTSHYLQCEGRELHYTEWGAQHQHELMENWRLASNQQPLNPIAPLD